jgi:LemA protein
MPQMLEGNTNRGSMKKGLIGVIVVVVLLGLVAMSYISARNSIAVKSNGIDAAFSEIDVNLQRRADLIPNLVASVKGYAKVETTVLTNIAEARSGLLQAKTPDEKLAAAVCLAAAADAHAGGVSRPEEQPAVHAAGRRAVGHGKPHCGSSQAVQRLNS